MIQETYLEILNSTKDTNATDSISQNVQNPSTYELASKNQVVSKASEDNYQEVDFDEDDEYTTSASNKKEGVYTVNNTQSYSLTSSNKDDEKETVSDNNANDNKTSSDNGSINMKAFKQLLSADEEADEIIAEYGYDKFFELFDKDNDGVITEDEIKEIDDTKSSLSDFTVDEIKELINGGKESDEEETELSPELIQKLKDAFANQTESQPQTQTASPVQSTGSTGSSGGVSGTGSTGGTSSTGSTSSNSQAPSPIVKWCAG